MRSGWCSRKAQKSVALSGVSPHPTCAGVSWWKEKAQINSVLTNTESTIWWAAGLESVDGQS